MPTEQRESSYSRMRLKCLFQEESLKLRASEFRHVCSQARAARVSDMLLTQAFSMHHRQALHTCTFRYDTPSYLHHKIGGISRRSVLFLFHYEEGGASL